MADSRGKPTYFAVYGRKRGTDEPWWRISRTVPGAWHVSLVAAKRAAKDFAKRYPNIEYKGARDGVA